MIKINDVYIFFESLDILIQIFISFRDVAGCDEAKLEIKEFVDFLKHPKKYTDLGAKIPKGVLLSGPPGSGKTLLARATAGESDVPFFQVKGSEFMEMFVGVGSSRLRSLFEKARNAAPSIVFIDEIDAIGRKRSDNSSGYGSHREFDNTLNQLLVEMDGFHDKKLVENSVIVMGATNLPNVLDSALTRAGRFDRHIMIPLPDKVGRKQIFDVHLRPIKVKVTDKEPIMSRLAEMTPGMSGADIENICNEGAIIAARNNCQDVRLNHFESAIERIIGGLERKTLRLDPKELKIVAYHEAGHAITGHFMNLVDPLIKISIIPRGKGLGYTQFKTTDNYLSSREKLFQMMCNLLGGRAAEIIKFSDFTSGAADDLMRVTELAYSYVATFGMSDAIGPIHHKLNALERTVSDATLSKIDREVQALIDKAMTTTKSLLLSKVDILDKVAQALIANETLSSDQFLKIVNE